MGETVDGPGQVNALPIYFAFFSCLLNLTDNTIKAVQREILLSFWKIHILHHAAEGPVVGF
jgi:hypothetical protein